MTITVTLNPAVDKTVEIADFKAGDLNRVLKIREDPGGKGINVSRAVNNLGGSTLALGVLGGSSGQFIAKSLEEANIDSDFVWVEGKTRTNIKIVDIENKVETEINEPGLEITERDQKCLLKKILKRAEKGDCVILTGSLPPGASIDTYNKLVTELKQAELRPILDTSGLSLEKGLEAKPELIKPNLEELENLVGEKLVDLDEVVEAGLHFYKSGVKQILISLGAKGAILVDKKGVWQAEPPQIKVASTIGAGDALLGAFTLKLNQGFKLEKALSYAVAASAGSVAKPGTKLCTIEEAESLLKEVKVKRLKGGVEDGNN